MSTTRQTATDSSLPPGHVQGELATNEVVTLSDNDFKLAHGPAVTRYPAHQVVYNEEMQLTELQRIVREITKCMHSNGV